MLDTDIVSKKLGWLAWIRGNSSKSQISNLRIFFVISVLVSVSVFHCPPVLFYNFPSVLVFWMVHRTCRTCICPVFWHCFGNLFLWGRWLGKQTRKIKTAKEKKKKHYIKKIVIGWGGLALYIFCFCESMLSSIVFVFFRNIFLYLYWLFCSPSLLSPP